MKLLLRILFFTGGLSLIVFSISSPFFYDQEGILQGNFCLPFSCGIGLLLLSFFLSRIGFWAATGLIGQAALLQTIDAGKRLHYQHYRPLDSAAIPLLILVLQAILVGAAIWKHRSILGGWMRKHGAIFTLAALSVVSISAAVSEDVSYFFYELLFASVAGAVQLGNLYLIVREFHAGYFSRAFYRFVSGEHADRDRYGICSAAWMIVAGILLSFFVYERHPHVNDEVAYLFQARMLAAGHLTIEAPPVPKAFELYLFQYTHGRMFVVPPPGWPAMLAFGVWLKAPWLINPLLAGLNIWLVYFVLMQVCNRRIARLSVFLLCFSPWFVFMSMNFMTHQWSTTCVLVCVAGIIQIRRTGNIRWAFLSGLFLGIQSLIRPLDGVVLGVLLGLWMIGLGGKRLKFPAIIAFALGTLVTGSLIFPYNAYFTGNPLQYPVNAYNESLFGKNANAYGFGKDHGMDWALDPLPGHGPLAATINAQLNGSQINNELFGWSIGSLWFFFLLIFSRSFQRGDIHLLAVLGAVFLAYFFYYFSGGPDFGARYWFMMIVPLVALSVRGMDILQSRIQREGIQVFAAILVLVFFGFINYFPWRSVDKYHHYLYMRPEICSVVTDSGSSAGDLVVVQGERFPDFASAMVCNPLDFRKGSPIFVWDRGPASRKSLESSYPGRNVWTVRGPSVTGHGYERTDRPAKLP